MRVPIVRGRPLPFGGEQHGWSLLPRSRQASSHAPDAHEDSMGHAARRLQVGVPIDSRRPSFRTRARPTQLKKTMTEALFVQTAAARVSR